MNTKIKFDLMANAIDSLEHAVEHLTNSSGPTGGDLKRSIRDVYHSVELILKEALSRTNEALVWKNIDKYPLIDAQTVGAETAINRLKNICKKELTGAQYRTIIDCRDIRNKIEHFHFEVDEREARAIIGRMVSFILIFTKSRLDIDLKENFKKSDVWSELIEIVEFRKTHIEATEAELGKTDIFAIECPACGGNTFKIDDMECAFCGFSEEMEECDQCKQMFFVSDLNEVTFYQSKYHEENGYLCDHCMGPEDTGEYWDR